MFPQGIIYQAGKSSLNGVVTLTVPKSLKIFFKLIRMAGLGLTVSVVFIIFFSFAPIIKEEVVFNLKSKVFVSAHHEVPKIPIKPFPIWSNKQSRLELKKAEETKSVQDQAKTLGIDPHFSLYVPKIYAKSNVMANVDASNEKEYSEALKKGVAHAKGTGFPGEGKTIFLFSHSTGSPLDVVRYSAIFYLLRKMEKDDEITIFFADKKYEYKVIEKKVVLPQDTSWLKSSPQDGERLILQTCTPPGTRFKRLLVIAKPVFN